MKILKKILFVLLCIMIFAGCYFLGARTGMQKFINDKFASMKVNWNDSVGTMTRDISYGDRESNKYNLYLPAAKKDHYALILHIHGGGFTAGDKKEGETICKYYASLGYVTASVNYSLIDESHYSNLNVMGDEILAALDHLVKTAADHGYNITEMATTGESAGGTLALLIGLKYNDKTPVPVRFVMEESGPACFLPELWYPNATAQEKIDFVNNMTRLNFQPSDLDSEQYREAVDSISPSAFITEDSVPLLLAYGAGDVVVPPNIKEPLLQALDDNHSNYTYILFPDSEHSLYNNPEQMQEYRNKMNEFVQTYFDN